MISDLNIERPRAGVEGDHGPFPSHALSPCRFPPSPFDLLIAVRKKARDCVVRLLGLLYPEGMAGWLQDV